jgi:protein AroM
MEYGGDMSISSVALLTIGQSPRADLADPIRLALPAALAIRQVGLLDGLSTAQVARRFSPRAGAMPLVTLMNDGSVVSISSDLAEEALQQAIDRLEQEGTDAIVMLCTGSFERLSSGKAWLIQPDRIVPALVAGLVRGRRVGILVPDEGQIDFGPSKWPTLDVPPLYAAASPYGDIAPGLEEAGRALKGAGAEAIVLDCMAFGARHRAIVARATGLPVLVSSHVVAAAIGPRF